ncbi:MAG: helix-hairpin-helix domain-containing protein [Gammaproteobacteria bacterium]|nr:helix-hairpin-helix domain-containing protein [Gammaproteobacteria bacterium]
MLRQEIKKFRDIPNIGKAIEKDFAILEMKHPAELVGKDPYQLYAELCRRTAQRHDPCLIDVLISAVRYMEGGPPRKWWEFTQERKSTLARQSPTRSNGQENL